MHNVLLTLLPLICISGLCNPVPVSNCARFQQSLHAYVQVRKQNGESGGLCLTYPISSLVTGSRSHKTVTSDVSRILNLYYTDSVSDGVKMAE